MPDTDELRPRDPRKQRTTEALLTAAEERGRRRRPRRVDEQNARMVDAIERGIADGTIRQVDARKAATILWASWNGIISLAWRPDEFARTTRASPRCSRSLPTW